MNSLKRIPYGKSDFEYLKGDYYVDKTAFMPHLEASPFNFFLRPRRFGKSLLLSTMQTYYDVLMKDRFEEFYANTWIFNNPTAERAKYMILYFNFSAVAKAIEKIQADFDGYCADQIDRFANSYAVLLPDGFVRELKSRPTAHEKLRFICSGLQRLKFPIYILIDEYDNFTNTIITEHGSDSYHALTRGSGAFRDFFSVLKAGTSGSGSPIARLFITGVSPVTMDDVTSGFNIGKNVSHNPALNACCGFTREETVQMLDYYAQGGAMKVARNEALEILEHWAGHYRFSKNATESVFNSDMVLYFIGQSIDLGELPQKLIDPNIKTDYGKLRNLLMIDLQTKKTLNGNFNMLKEISDTGQVSCDLVESFPNRAVAERENFMSLIYHLGFLTRSEAVEGRPMLKVPNQSMQSILYEFMRAGLKDANSFAVDVFHLGNLMAAMAYRGQWPEVFKFIAEQINAQTGIRDFIEGERMIQGFFMAYLNMYDHFRTLSEVELNRGYSDLVLLPSAQYQDMPWGFVLELKYLKRVKGLRTPKGKAELKLQIQAVVTEAQAQIDGYVGGAVLPPLLQRQDRKGPLKLGCGVIVFHGWEMVHCEDYEPSSPQH